MRRTIYLLAPLASPAAAFTYPTTSVARAHPTLFSRNLAQSNPVAFRVSGCSTGGDHDRIDFTETTDVARQIPATAHLLESTSIASAIAATAAIVSTPEASFAAGPDWGIFEGKSLSLLHPVMMFGMLALSISTAVKGFDYRRQRSIGGEISALKKQMPDLGGAKTIAKAIEIAKSEEGGGEAMVATLTAGLETEDKIKELKSQRKELSGKDLRGEHHNQGAILAAIGTIFAVEGPLNTYARAGKLFPGPHLYAAAGLVACWSIASACVPFMQKGNDGARNLHIGANIAGIGLFAWQVQSGIPILLKVWEKTQWP